MIKKIGAIVLILSLLITVPVMAKDASDYKTPTKVRCTCYYEGKITRSGEPVREGIIAGRKEWLGKTAIIYDLNMNVIGIYEFKDTGGADSLKNGTSIDVYRTSLQRCKDWIKTYGDYVYLEIVDAEG